MKAPTMTFAEACSYVRPLGLRGRDDFISWYIGERPDLPPVPAGLPACPNKVDVYRGEWRGWSHFLSGSDPAAPKSASGREEPLARAAGKLRRASETATSCVLAPDEVRAIAAAVPILVR